MLDLRNRTPFVAAIVPLLDKDGRDHATVAVKGTFDLGRRGEELPVSDRQAPLVRGDVFHGEPGASSVKYEADSCPMKGGTDVVLVGSAYSPAPVQSLDVTLAAGMLRKIVRVTGDRRWVKGASGWEISRPVPFHRMPLVYERAFGGADMDDPAPERRGFEARNPVGAGFCAAERPARIEGLRLPNLEDPEHLVRAPLDRPPPAGFGFIARDWQPRLRHAGTYDERWREERMPLLPLDFDPRHFRSAHPDLAGSRHLKGGEPVLVSGASEGGDVAFRVPARALSVRLSIRGAVSRHRPLLDTLLIEPDERRVVATWRVTVPCPRSFLYIEEVHIEESAS